MVYSPREDSFLLRDQIKHYARGTVLDMGTGSGIQAEEAAKFADAVVAADVNPEALIECMKTIANEKIKFVESDLFSNITGTFDLILFNPPYLPNHPKSKDVALDGGVRGYELTIKFLEQAYDHLSSDGKILLLISSETKKRIVESKMRRMNYEFKVIATQKLEFETLYIYFVGIKSILSKVTSRKMFSKGKRGVVEVGFIGKKKVAIKSKRNSSKVDNAIAKEAAWLKIVNKLGIGPKFIAYQDGCLISEFIDGVFLPEFIRISDKKKIALILQQVMRQCRELDRIWVSKLEMTMPKKHVIITKKMKTVMIDFERCRKTEKPKNVTQFCQYLTLNETSRVLHEKGFIFAKQEVIDLARDYKRKLNERCFKKIMEILK
jgi:release factor glutamine methyltransferase